MNDAKEEVRAKLAIEDVIGEYVNLKRAGRYWRGLSPFTNEKTPSFFVTPERDIWHDFSSNQGGDIFTFIEMVEGVGFREALEILARKAGVDLAQFDQNAPRDLSARKNRILEMNNLATNYFQREMTKNKIAIDYIFKRRKLTKEIVMEWGIGFAPENSSLKKLLISRKFNEKEIREAGLISARGREMFFARMMIPLRDGQGQIVGFTGRIVGAGEPKYLNTPATILYDKGRQVFGLNFAKNFIRTENFAVICEGNLDVISSHQAGVKNVVACAGTALTRDHLKSLSRLSRNVALCFDDDRAGISATERAIILAQPLELKLSVVDWNEFDFAKILRENSEIFSENREKNNSAKKFNVIPLAQRFGTNSEVEGSQSAKKSQNPNSDSSKSKISQNDKIDSNSRENFKIPKDPDEIISNFGAQIWREIVVNYTTPAVEWVIKKYIAEVDIESADGQKIVVARAGKLIKNLASAVEKEFYIKLLSSLTGAQISTIEQEIYSTSSEKKPLKILKTPKNPRREISRENEQYFLNLVFAIALKIPRLRSILANLPDEYLTENFARIKYFLLDLPTKRLDGETSKRQNITPEMADKMAELEIIADREIRENDDERVLILANLLELEKLKLRAKFESLNSELASVLENSENSEKDAENSSAENRAKILNGAVNGLKKDLNLLEKSGARDDFVGLFEVWKTRKNE